MRLFVLLTLCVDIVACANLPMSEQRPNIIVIMADDLGYGDISPYGGWIETPGLEQLAAQGLLFTDFHTSGNSCSPTRAGLLTGHYQQRAGIHIALRSINQDPTHYHGLHPVESTLAEGLQDAGYATAIFGKWHLGFFPEYNPLNHGFDEFRGSIYSGDYVSHIDGHGREDWWFNTQKVPEAGYSTHLITRHAINFIEAHADEPFLLYLPHFAPHYPYQGPNDPAERSVGGKFEALGSRPDKREAYREMVQAMDDGIGEVIATLDRLDLRENTIVWFLSDNGGIPTVGSNAPLRGAKGWDYEGGHRVPSIVSWPSRIAEGATEESLTISLDLMPTLLALAGTSPDPSRPMDGIDLSGLLFSGINPTQRQLYWNGDSMRDGSWKLCICSEGRFRGAQRSITPQLFNLSEDPGERNDLAAQYPNRVQHMLQSLRAWQEDVAEGATPQPRAGL